MVGECQLQRDTKKKFNGEWGIPNLKLGQVDFINCLPINLPIELGEVEVNANIINAVPSKLNKMILNNEIDIAPVSSVTYLENKDKLMSIGELCIASNGPADSVLLFSRFPIEELNRAKVLLSEKSATSNILLQIVFKEFLNLEATFEVNKNPQAQDSNYPAILLIGDDALLAYSKRTKDIFIYDLGELWKKYTELPMVFGIWVARTSGNKEIEIVANKLRGAQEIGLGISFDKVLDKAQEKIALTKDFYKKYFEHLSYDLTSEHKEGLELFEKYAYKQLQLQRI